MSFSLFSRLALLLIIFSLCSNGTDAQSREDLQDIVPAFPTSLAAGSSRTTFRQILLDAFRQLLAAPMKIMKTLIREVRNFFRGHNLTEFYDVKVLKHILSRAPKRLLAYYDALVGLEHNCLQRTVCDVAEYTSHRVPKWVGQIAFIYFNTFAQQRPYYEVIVQGLTVRNCAALYTECDPEMFIERLRNNVVNATEPFPIDLASNEI